MPELLTSLAELEILLGVDLRAVDVINRLLQHGLIKNQSVLTLGRQSINVPIQDWKWLDELLLQLGAKRADSMDVSAYENASIVFDLQKPAPHDYFSQWDLILDFGTTEHIFDQKTTLNNIYNFLKPNGIYVAIIPRTNWNDHGLYQYSPEFYWTLGDVFPFAIECYTVSVTQNQPNYFLYKNYGQDPAEVRPTLSQDKTYNICFARKVGPDVFTGQISTSPRYRDNFHKNGSTAGLSHATVETLSVVDFLKRPLSPVAPRIGIIHIATGPYKMFTERFVSSGVTGFEDGFQKVFYLITDDPDQFAGLENSLNCMVRHLKIDHEPWPSPTLKRFEYIAKLKSQFIADGVTHLFFVNANAVFISANPVTELIAAGKPIGFVQHPGFLDDPSSATFESQKESLAYIPDLNPTSETYVQGFFYGGETEAFLKMVLELRDRVQDDLDRGVIAVWHDESHLNWARISRWRDQSLVFDFGYAFPEGWKIDAPCRILSLDKSKLMDLSFKR